MTIRGFKRALKGQKYLTAACVDMAASLIAFEGIPDSAQTRFEYDKNQDCIVFKAKWEDKNELQQA